MRTLIPLSLLALLALGCKGKEPVDADGDGANADIDCDDADPEVFPWADEICDGKDNDCDGLVDEDDPGLVGAPTAWDDADADGFGAPGTERLTCDTTGLALVGGDCEDGDPLVNPDMPEICGDGIDNDCDGGDETCPVTVAALPVAPGPGRFMAQGVQTAFVDDDGGACVAHVAVAVGDQAACYVDSAGALRCAGRIYEQSYGTSFAATGLTEVSQVMLAPTFNAENGNGGFALAHGVPHAVGLNNFSGQLGTGDQDPAADWTAWDVPIEDASMIATGTNDQLCALDGDGAAWCTGSGVGLTPTLTSVGPHTGVAIDTFGTLLYDPTDRWRHSQGRAECSVRAAGLVCGVRTLGRPGHVVDGGYTETTLTEYDPIVWLEDDGAVTRSWLDTSTFEEFTAPMFASRPVVAIAYHDYTDTVCAVPDDGSLWCVGSNEQGKLGTGNTADLTAETRVQPPGTFDLTCR